MGCGDPHRTPCAEVRAFVYVYLDGEIDETHRVEVWAHLQECHPCAQEYSAEELLKERVGRSCRCDATPVHLRTRIISEIQRISVTYRSQ